MMIGHTDKFAIESHNSRAFEELGLRALGFFTLLVNGMRFGVREDDATMLANSFDEVCRRLARRGQHVAPFGADGRACDIASSILSVLYCDVPREERHLGLTNADLDELAHRHHLVWAPDGDAAFDDRSHVLHFDVGNQVRLIAFKRGDGGSVDPSTLVDQWLPSDEFYQILKEWRDRFLSEWEHQPKEPSMP